MAAWLAFTRPEQRSAAPLRARPVFAAISFGANPRASLKPRVEPKTGLDFPELFCSRGSAGCAELQGVGVRAKNIAGLHVNVYAVGVYVDEAALSRVVKPKHKGKAAAALAKDAALFADVVAADVEKSLRLVFARGVKADAVADALAERLEPKLGKASPALAAFKAAFAGAAINRGTVVTLSAAKGGKLHCVVAGKAQKPIASPELCRALFDIYLGRDPVAPAAKASFGEALAKRITA